MRYFIAEELGVSPSRVEAMTLGSHGEAMVPLPRQARVEGKPLTEESGSDDGRVVTRRSSDPA